MEIFKQLNKKGYKHYYGGTIEELDNMDKDNPDLYSEIMQVIMWLCEKHGVWVCSYPDAVMQKGWYFTVFINTNTKTTLANYHSEADFKSPTEAYEAAIEYTLNNLI